MVGVVTSAELDELFTTAADAARADAEHDDVDDDEEPEGIAAAALTRSGAVLVGVCVDAMVDSACLCAETGPICEAHHRRDPIHASVCVRWTPSGGSTVLPACGVCQERLAVFGEDVLVAVGRTDTGVEYATLADLRPHPWWRVAGM